MQILSKCLHTTWMLLCSIQTAGDSKTAILQAMQESAAGLEELTSQVNTTLDGVNQASSLPPVTQMVL